MWIWENTGLKLIFEWKNIAHVSRCWPNDSSWWKRRSDHNLDQTRLQLLSCLQTGQSRNTNMKQTIIILCLLLVAISQVNALRVGNYIWHQMWIGPCQLTLITKFSSSLMKQKKPSCETDNCKTCLSSCESCEQCNLCALCPVHMWVSLEDNINI